MAGRKYGLDLGTNYVKIYNNTRKNILVEHNMIAIRKKKEVIACGDDAYEIFEKVSDTIGIRQPVRNGVIADVEPMGKLFDHLLKKMDCSNSMMRHKNFTWPCHRLLRRLRSGHFFTWWDTLISKSHNAGIVEKPVAACCR